MRAFPSSATTFHALKVIVSKVASPTGRTAPMSAPPARLLAQVSSRGKITAFGVTVQAIYTALSRRGGEAGVDVASLQAIMGHSSPPTTARHYRRPEDTKRKAMESVAIPYARQR
jgi:hypothetical protein